MSRPLFVKSGGSQKQASDYYLKNGGSWTRGRLIYKKVNGTWQHEHEYTDIMDMGTYCNGWYYFGDCPCGEHSTTDPQLDTSLKNASNHNNMFDGYSDATVKTFSGYESLDLTQHNKIYKCAACNVVTDTVTENHDIDISTVSVATCLAAAVLKSECSLCDFENTYSSGDVDPNNHTGNSVESSRTVATCSKTGTIYYKYDCCDASAGTSTLEIDPENHDGNVLTPDGYSQYNADQHYYHYKCNACNTRTSSNLEDHSYELTYTWSNDYTGCNASAVCDACDYAVNETGNSSMINHIDGTCTEKEQWKYTATFTNSLFTTQTTETLYGSTDPDNHAYLESEVIAPTCTASGYTIYVCIRCDDSYNDNYVEMLGHNAESTYTYDENGHWKECTRCDEKATAVSDHTYGDATYKWSGTSCTATASCTECGRILTETKTGTRQTVSAATCNSYETYRYYVSGWDNSDVFNLAQYSITYTGTSYNSSNHTNLVDVASKAATCTTDGNIPYSYCSGCGKYYNGKDAEISQSGTVIPATGHTEVDGGELDSHKECSVCGTILENNDYHSYTSSVSIKPTCITKGTTLYTCDCGYSYTLQDIAINPLSHEGGVETVATADICTRWDCCKATIASGHSYYDPTYEWSSDYTSCTAKAVCSECGYTVTETSNSSETNHVDGTCTEKEQWKYTATFTNSLFSTQTTGTFYGSTDPDNHAYLESEVIAPTCTTGGYTIYVCIRCNDSYNDNYTTMLGHNSESTYTYNENGHWKECTRCDEKATAVSDHSYGTPSYSWDSSGVCTASATCGCGYTLTESKIGVYETTTTATCTTAEKYRYKASGWTNSSVFSTQYSTTYTGSTDPSNHSNLSTGLGGYAATCTATGRISYSYCSGCGKYYNSSGTEISQSDTIIAIDSSNHSKTTKSYTNDADQACQVWDCCGAAYTIHTGTNGGTASVHTKCSRCGVTMVGSSGHSYSSSVTTAATCTSTGIRTYTCACGYSYTETIAKDASNHRDAYGTSLLSSFDAVAATCTSTGNIAYSHCDGCDKYYNSSGTEISASATITAKNASNHSKTTKSYTYNASKACQTWDCCGATYTSHSSTSGGTENAHTKCSRCGTALSSSHSYASSVTSPTCTASGYTTKTCSCGYSYTTDYTEMLGHNSESTYSYNASGHWKECTRCDEKATAVSGHSYSVSYSWDSAGVCTGTATCACGYTQTESRIGVYETVTAGTCTTAETYRYKASGWTNSLFSGTQYSTTYTGSKDASNHSNLGTGLGGYAATCTTTGRISYSYCSGCGKYYNSSGTEISQSDTIIAIDSSNHSKTTKSYTYNAGQACQTWDCCGATYTSHSSTYGGTSSVHTKCSRCGTTLSSSHSYTSSVTNPTCTASGYTTKTCACGYSYTTDYIDPPGHSSTYGGTASVHTKCSVCGTTLSSSHSYTSSVTSPTCTAQGYTTKTCACGYSYTTDYTSATGHSDISGGTASVHTKCSVCGVTTSSTHYYVDNVTAPTCTAQGYTTKQCTCGYSYKTNYTNATGHSYSYVSNYDGTHYTKCSVCGATTSSVSCPQAYLTSMSDDNYHYYGCTDGCGYYNSFEHSPSYSGWELVGNYHVQSCSYCGHSWMHQAGYGSPSICSICYQLQKG